jgi:DNA-binding transcriptional ArsR family regulator
MGDPARLRILQLLTRGECCVSELVEVVGEKFSTVSQRLRVLRGEGLVSRRRRGTHLIYALADRHVAGLIEKALAHAAELEPAAAAGPKEGGVPMSTPHTHANHSHQHGPGCGHTAVKHDGHTDYLHDGHLHHPTAGGTVEEHVLPVGGTNPAACTPSHSCGGHPAGHQHGAGCGHEAVPHGDHVDYLVNGHLHHPHAGHCDDHGAVHTA